jgi:hypothetical protein
MRPLSLSTSFLAVIVFSFPCVASIAIKDRVMSQPLVLDQNEDYFLHKVVISGVTDAAALTLTGKINSVNLSNCMFSNVWSGMNSKAAAAESQGAIVGSFVATDTAFEDSQHQLLCLREGSFGTVTIQRCRFRTTDSFLKKIYASDPWRTAPPTTEFANIDRLELLDNEYLNTVLVVHPSVKVVIFRGDLSNVRLESPGTHVIRLEKGQDPSTINSDGTAVATAAPASVPSASVTVTAPDKTQTVTPAVEVPSEPRVEPVSGADADPAVSETQSISLVMPTGAWLC